MENHGLGGIGLAGCLSLGATFRGLRPLSRDIDQSGERLRDSFKVRLGPPRGLDRVEPDGAALRRKTQRCLAFARLWRRAHINPQLTVTDSLQARRDPRDEIAGPAEQRARRIREHRSLALARRRLGGTELSLRRALTGLAR